MKTTFVSSVNRIAGTLRAMGPYLAIGLLVPGGSVVALALWLHNRKQPRA